MLRLGNWRGPALGVALGVGAAAGCTAILDPEKLDDVDRCEFDADCPEPDDARFRMICVAAEEVEADIDFPKICTPRSAASCDPMEYDYYTPFRTAWRDSMSIEGRYEGPCGDFPGIQGCPPDVDGNCAEGLSKHKLSGRCDDQDDDTPPAIAPVPLVAGQDVLDQFCRSLYCDVDYVCHKGDFECVPCELGESIGRGGCGDLYLGGERSSVYRPDEDVVSQCVDARDEDEFHEAQLGPVTEVDLGEGGTGGAGTGTGAGTMGDTGG